LKALEIAMRSENVVDLPYPVGATLADHEKDRLIQYNNLDVRETLKFAARSQAELQLRERLSEKYGVNMMNMSNSKIGSTILIRRMEEAGIQCYERDGSGRKVPRQTYRSVIRLGEVVFPYVRFERPELQQVLDYFKSAKITETKGVFDGLSATVDGFRFDFGVGGIHGSIESQIVRSDAEHQIVDVDVTSYYPRMAIVHRMYPAHLG